MSDGWRFFGGVSLMLCEPRIAPPPTPAPPGAGDLRIGVALGGLAPTGSQGGTGTGVYFPGPDPMTTNPLMLYENALRLKKEDYINCLVLH
jgi:hypothetical protein